jgi:hypothetical protein
MNTILGRRSWVVGRGVFALVLVSAVPVLAQAPPGARSPEPGARTARTARTAKPGEVATDPIKCWWKADRTAVRVGERFGLTLSCGVVEAGPVTVVPAINQLEGGALALTPFEVVSSVRREDVVSAPWRYFQFEYVLRVLSDGFFGQDINIPALTVTYNIKVEGSDSEGRDQSYVLPALPMKVLSVVPRGADDIRDASEQTFALIESRRFRSSVDMVVAGVLFAGALVCVGLALVAGTARFRTRTSGSVKPMPATAMLSGSLKALEDVRAQAAAGWTPELARQAMSALRVGGAIAINRPVGQEFVSSDVPVRPGQVAARTGLLRPRRALLAASTTAPALDKVLANGHTRSAKRRALIQPLAESLRTFNSASYGRSGEADAIALNAALSDGTDAIKRLRTSTVWPMRYFG